jgi:hypothetical protein
MISLNMKRKLFLLLFVLSSCSIDGDSEERVSESTDWEILETDSPFLMNVKDFDFLTDKVGFSFGNYVLKTTDGGKSFNAITSFFQPDLYSSFSAFDENHIWYGLDQINSLGEKTMKLFKTEDGGMNWVESSLGNLILTELSFMSKNEGFALGFYWKNEQWLYQLFKTSDAGKTWIPNLEVDLKEINAEKILWKTKELGFILSFSGTEYRTLDGGTSWDKFTSGTPGISGGFYPVTPNRYFDIQFDQTLIIEGLNQTPKELSPKRVFVLTTDENKGSGILLNEGCLFNGPCTNTFVTTLDGGLNWTKHQEVAYSSFAINYQEIKPGLVVFYQQDTENFIWIKAK